MWQKYKKIHTDTVWIILVVFFTVYLLRPRHKRDRHHLYHRWQINQKVTDHDGQRIVALIVIQTTRAQIYKK